MKILAIETSCDETAAAVIEKTNGDIKILSNVISSQIKIHQKFGGVFPEYASRAHAEKIIPVVKEALGKSKPDTVAVTIGPGLIGSLLVGVNFAKTYAFVKKLPIIGINHWLGHIYSVFGGENSKFKIQNSKLPKFPILVLIASGGHTGLVLMKSHTEIETLGETLDDAAGEAFDKVAKLLHLGYPGGPAIAQAAEKCHSEQSEESPANAGSRTSREILHYVQDDNFKFPRSMLGRKDYNFSFSGLKTAVLYKVRELTKRYPLNVIRSQIAYEFQQAVIDILIGKTLQAAGEFRPKSICLCGGVAANQELRAQMAQRITQSLNHSITFHVPPIELATDNAAMIGIAAAYHLDQKTTWDQINAEANLRLA